jgi:hypothetical protein
MAKVDISDGTLTIALSPADKFWSMHGSFHIPLAHVTGAEVVTENGWHFVWNKLIGTNAPGIKIAGTYFTGDGIVFCDFGNGTNCIEIATQHERYKKLIVELDPDQDRDSIVAQINTAATH